MANGPTQAYKRIKQALRQTYENGLGDQLALEAKLQGEAGKSRDFVEGVMAFLEKRPAEFTDTTSADMPDFYPWWK